MSNKYKILIVDDIEMNRALLGKIFENDYTIYEAENGQEAMKILAEQDVNIVLLDLSMPVMDGYEVIYSMKADQKIASIPIVVTTGAIDKSERRAFDLGADDFITKPFDPYIVRKRVENLIQKYVLQVDNLKQALSQAEQLNRAKGSFLARMSHELRSPINSIISLTSLLQDEKDDQKAVIEYSNKIEESSRYLLGVINDVLNVSAIENQKIVITCSPFNFRKLLEGIAAMFYGQCKEKNIDFALNINSFTEEYLFGDPMRLKEVLINLISNAIKFTSAGGKITVRVNQLSRVSQMIKLRFQVIDNGEGISQDRLAAIFQPFTQESSETMKEHGGSGLGLSIVKNIVELMGGQVDVSSHKGAGSTFTIDLPFTVSKELPQMTSEKLKKIRALLIDDDRETQEYGKKIMEKLEIHCDVVDSGEKALEIMQEAYDKSEGYDICFIDWRMPKMSGVDITRKIREIFDDDTVIVVASAYDLSEITQEAKMAGADVVVPKPMFQSTVFDLLMNISSGVYVKKYEGADYHFEGKKILIAEDNSLNAEIASEVLKMVGFETVRAVDGKEVCEIFENSPTGTFDGILMDIQMPIMDGHKAAIHIRSSNHPQAKTIPIIALTANAFTEDVKASLASGMNVHLAKPIDSSRLYETMDKFVGQTNK